MHYWCPVLLHTLPNVTKINDKFGFLFLGWTSGGVLMSWTYSRRFLGLALLAVAAVAVAPAASHAAILLYQQVFNPPAPAQSGAILPWSINMIGGFEGTYSGSFDPGGLVDSPSGAPIGRTGPSDPAGTALYTGIGGAVTGNLCILYAGRPGGRYVCCDRSVAAPQFEFQYLGQFAGRGRE